MFVRTTLEHRADVGSDDGGVERLRLERHLVGADLGCVQQVVDDREQVGGVAADGLDVPGFHRRGVAEDVSEADDRGQGRAELVRDVGDELVARAGGAFCERSRPTQIFYHADVFGHVHVGVCDDVTGIGDVGRDNAGPDEVVQKGGLDVRREVHKRARGGGLWGARRVASGLNRMSMTTFSA